MAIDTNIGYFKNIVDNANRVNSLIEIGPKANPMDQLVDYNDVRYANDDSPFSDGYFVWGISNWGGNELVGE